MKYILVVIHPFTFEGVFYGHGAEISDAKTIAKVEASDNKRSCNRVLA